MKIYLSLLIPAVFSLFPLFNYGQTVCFGPEITDNSFLVGGNPMAVTSADFNGDGFYDVATANNSTSNISVVSGKGNGLFNTAVNYGAGSKPQDIEASDVNGDAITDLIVLNNGSVNVSVLAGKLNGTFSTAVNYPVSGSPYDFDVKDLNNDGYPDIISAPRLLNYVSVLMNNGDGTYAPMVNYNAGSGCGEVKAEDMNGDGFADLIVGNYTTKNISILFNTGTGTFGSTANYSTGGLSNDISIRDLDLDGKPDICVLSSDINVVSVFINNGGGTLKPVFNYSVMHSGYFTLADMNKDMYPDVLLETNDGISIHLNNGDGTFGAGKNYPSAERDGWGQPVARDFTGDGNPDVVFASGSVVIMINKGNGELINTYYTRRTGGDMPYDLQAGDMDGDGDIDLVTPNSNSNDISVVMNTGNGTFAAATNYSGNMPWGVGIGDLNADGLNDLAIANRGSNQLSIRFNNGNGSFGNAVNYSTTDPNCIAIADFSGDNIPDVVLTNRSPGTITYYMNDGSGGLTKIGSYAVSSVSPRSIHAADFNADGKMDIATANYGSNNISILLNNGNGFSSASKYTVGTSSWNFTSGDLNMDGFPDLAVVCNNGSSFVSVLLNNGSGSFGAAVNYSTGSIYPSSVGIKDYNGDGYPDLSVTTNTAVLKYFENTGTGTFLNAVDFSIYVADYNIPGDYDNDGKQDIGMASAVGVVQVLFNTTAFIHSTTPLPCQKPPLTLYGNKNGLFHSWSAGNFSADSMIASSTGTYTNTITNLKASCTTTASKTISLFQGVHVSGNTNLCKGQSTTLTASGTSTYLWSTGKTGNVETLNPLADTSYTVIGTDLNNCVDTTLVSIHVNEPPLVSISGITAICKGTSSTLAASGADYYLWSTGGTNDMETMNPFADSTYSVIGTDLNNCTDTATITIQTDSLPDKTVVANDMTLSANASNILYQWYSCDHQMIISGETNQSYTATENGNYSVILSDGACTDTSACIFVSSVGMDKSMIKKDIQIFPNPSNGIITIKNAGFIPGHFIIKDALGRMVCILQSDAEGKINLGGLENGVYFIFDQELKFVGRIALVKF